MRMIKHNHKKCKRHLNIPLYFATPTEVYASLMVPEDNILDSITEGKKTFVAMVKELTTSFHLHR